MSFRIFLCFSSWVALMIAFESAAGMSRFVVRNEGIAPFCHGAVVAVDGVRSNESLKGLAPGEEAVYGAGAGGGEPVLMNESGHLSTGQHIEFDADSETSASGGDGFVPLAFQLFGGIGLFLMGMVLLTDGIKAYAGDSLRKGLMRFTGTPGKAFASGALVTTLVQSSSATTVTVIGFVSAGLLTFPQALGVVFGASLGTTATGWVIAVLGLKISVGFYALPLVGAGAFLRLLAKGRGRALGTALAGFGLIFIGIETLQAGMEGLSGVFDLASLPSGGIGSHLLAMLIGIVMTVIMQSSSAAVATTLTALHTGAINFDQAASVVIGAAVGTTVTGVLAAIGGNVPAKRTALAHVLFNLATGLIAVALLPVLLLAIDQAQRHAGLDGGAMSLAAFHTVFIALGVVIFLPLVHSFARFIERVLPEREPMLTRHLDKTVLSAPSVALEAARRALSLTAAETLQFLKTSLERGGVKNKAGAAPLRKALEDISEFLSQVPPINEDEPLSGLRVGQMHAIDHLARLQSKLWPSAGARRIMSEAPLKPALSLTREILQLGSAGLHGEGAQGWLDTLSKKAHRLADVRRNDRLLILEETTASGAEPASALERLDALRWLDRIGYHSWRVCHYLVPEEDSLPKDAAIPPGTVLVGDWDD